MVLMIDALDQQSRTDRLLQSIDLAIKHLIDAGDDPLALAFYLWTIRQHNVPLINSDRLARWGAAWARRTLIDGILSRRRDEEITSAALAAAALAKTKALEGIEDEICTAVHQQIAGELDRNSIPFRQPSYGAILLFAAHKLGVDEPRTAEAAQAVINAYSGALPGGRMFGLGMVIEVLREIKRTDHLMDIRAPVLAAMRDPRTDYEDQLYLISALWHIHDKGSLPAEIFTDAEQVVGTSPTWSYLMSGQETLRPAEEELGEVTISHLYRAVLLDMLLLLRTVSHAQKEARLDAKYRGRRVTGFLSFCTPVLILAVLWFCLAELLIHNIDAAKQYWVFGDYDPHLHFSALLFLGGLLCSFYLGSFTVLSSRSLWKLLVVKTVESDWRLGQTLRHDAWKALRWWWIGLVVVLILGVGGNFLAPGVQHLFEGR